MHLRLAVIYSVDRDGKWLHTNRCEKKTLQSKFYWKAWSTFLIQAQHKSIQTRKQKVNHHFSNYTYSS